MAGEDNFYSMGQDSLIANINGWKINFLICYDLRFPVWAKNTYSKGVYQYDILLTVASWPEVRNIIWTTLLAARAIENQAFAIGVNRVGFDANRFHHTGDSNICDAKGNPLFHEKAGIEFTKTISLKFDELKLLRDKINVGLDWDLFQIENKINL